MLDDGYELEPGAMLSDDDVPMETELPSPFGQHLNVSVPTGRRERRVVCKRGSIKGTPVFAQL